MPQARVELHESGGDLTVTGDRNDSLFVFVLDQLVPAFRLLFLIYYILLSVKIK